MRSFTHLQGYDVAGRIGRGAGAVIYEARRRSTRDLVTIKHVVRQGPEDDRFLEQAENEYEVARQLDHPCLRRCLDIVRVRRWLKTFELFLIMEHVDGERLEDRRPTELVETTRLFTQIAEGLHALHKHGYAHADMKPNNILLTRAGPKIIDFGQSCPLGRRKERVQGTPDYIAPEQVLRHPIDQRTDVFNLGATMYWVVTGKWFRTLLNVGAAASKKIELDARSGSEPPHEVRPETPLPFSKLIMECCAARPDDRPADMREVATRLEFIQHLLTRKNSGASA